MIVLLIRFLNKPSQVKPPIHDGEYALQKTKTILWVKT